MVTAVALGPRWFLETRAYLRIAGHSPRVSIETLNVIIPSLRSGCIVRPIGPEVLSITIEVYLRPLIVIFSRLRSGQSTSRTNAGNTHVKARLLLPVCRLFLVLMQVLAQNLFLETSGGGKFLGVLRRGVSLAKRAGRSSGVKSLDCSVIRPGNGMKMRC